MYNRPSFVRLFAMGIPEWFKDKPDIDRLMKIFDPTEEQSVYQVESGEEEWLVAAAHALTTKKHPDAISVLRLREENLSRFGISLNRDELGTTGVPWVDLRHSCLRGTIGQLRELIKYLVDECSRGHDLVRRIDKPSIERSLRRLCAERDCICPPHVKNIAKSALKEAGLDLDLTKIQREVLGVEFHDDIHPRASSMSSGDEVADWYASVNALRQQYAGHYLPAITNRFRLR